LPVQVLPREEMDRVGPEKTSAAALLAIIMRSGAHGCSVVELAERLLKDYGTLTALSRCSIQELTRNPRYKGLGRVKAQCLQAALEIGRRMTQEQMSERSAIRSPADVFHLLEPETRRLDAEVFWTLHLDAKNRLAEAPKEISRGLLDASLVHPREVFSAAVRARCAALVLAHNHPSGDPTPSAEDVRITKQLIEAGKILDIKVLDHVVLGRPSPSGRVPFVSMREAGLAPFA
jgi:DNA repair protein RadC